jgi:hypothetical protein
VGVKASSVTVAAVLVAAAIVFTPAMLLIARADDFGAHTDIRAMRASAPILLDNYLARPLTIDDVVVDGDAAIATWHSAGKPGVATFRRRNDVWWLVATFDTSSPAIKRTTAAIARDLAIPADLAWQTEVHVPDIDTQSQIQRQVLQPACAGCLSTLWNDADGFEATLAFTAGTETWDPGFAIIGRAPTVGEMPPTPYENAYFFFRVVTKGSSPVMVRNGATLDIVFPYVLDTSKQYVLSLDFLRPDIEDLPGALHDNTLHFTLPAFETLPGKAAFGEVDAR